jgi:tetratricopeptide (TPR) repeat protein
MNLLWKAHQFTPNSREVQRQLAQALYSWGQIEEALFVIGNDDSHFLLAGEQRPEFLLLHACVLAHKGKIDEAVQSWRRGADQAVLRWAPEQYQLVETAGATMYQYLLHHEPDNYDWRYLLGSFLWNSGRRKEAVQEFETLTQLNPKTDRERRLVGEAFYMLGLSFAQDNRWQLALDTLEYGLALNPRIVEAYLLLESIYSRLGYVEKSTAVRVRLESLSPEWLISSGTGKEIKTGWIVYGYDLDPESIKEQPLLRLQFYWQLPEGMQPLEDGWFQTGDHWIQVVETLNLASNAGFEQDNLGSVGTPIGYKLYDGTPPLSQQIVLSEREGGFSLALQQRNITEGPSVGVWLQPIIEITADYYLFGAWKKSPDERSKGRIEWFDENMHKLQGENYTFLSDEGQSRIVDVLPVSDEVKWFRFSLFSGSDADWDDILIVPIRIP